MSVFIKPLISILFFVSSTLMADDIFMNFFPEFGEEVRIVGKSVNDVEAGIVRVVPKDGANSDKFNDLISGLENGEEISGKIQRTSSGKRYDAKYTFKRNSLIAKVKGIKYIISDDGFPEMDKN